ncbi:MAG TPA: peptidoglycan DD-metalloendopeptidase family protein [Chitinophagaceae bacterium]|nr:peptidoglycan DD-metalloendopeptidase family protein [Chitinophagaceae bacterium]
MRKTLLLVLFSGILGISMAQPPGQEKSQLEKERQEIQKDLKEIEGLYDKVKGQKKQTLGQLTVLNRKINLQEQYISSINKELRSIDDDIYLGNLEIYRLNRQVDTLKAQYARTVVYAYKNRSNYDYLNFIFSAGSFNDMIKRIAYLKSYRSYREKQVNTILETKELIAKRQQQQLARKDQKNVALENQTKQVEELSVQKKEKDVIVSELKSKEKDLQKQIAAKKKKDRDLQNAITAIVRREIEAAKKEAEAKARAEEEKRKATEITAKPNTKENTGTSGNPTTNTGTNKEEIEVGTSRTTLSKKPDSYLDLNSTDVALNNKFELNKGKLPWPVDNGVLTLRFGPNKIDNTLLTFDNPGITIATPSAGNFVKAVFDGEVSSVFNIGDGMVVTIRHGKYFTTYSNLSSVSVSKGMEVKTGQVIGKAGRDDEGVGGQVDFILMIETRNIDPQPWLRR